MTGRTDHLFRRPRSPFWHARFHFPRSVQAEFGKRMEDVNLKTTDRREAEIRCADLLHRHRRRVQAAVNKHRGDHIRVETGHKMTLGVHVLDDGREIVATADTLFIRLPDGTRTQEPNATTFEPYYVFDPDQPFDTVWRGDRPKAVRLKKVPDTSGDIVHLERWMTHKNITGYLEREARAVWDLFRRLTENKALTDCDRDDGRLLARHLLDGGNKTATVTKKVGHLCAAVNLAMAEGKLKFNPFSDVVPKMNDSERREPLTDEEMAKIQAGKDVFEREEWLLFMLCATTGMRRGEAYEINAEKVEAGIRYVVVGTKNQQSLRRVPLPKAVMPLLPATIRGPLFAKDLKNLGRQTLRRMRALGVDKDIHGLRHRAKDRLRAAGVPLDLQYEILGHEEKTIASSYGRGSPLPTLRHNIEKIGF
ncbi:Site-specific recombinase XerD [Methylobacterium sp. 275MFSha3.1]|uniref:tyrosine-type recombinase/integrase n=1 Tax=Methylobacterium sp. 275MFSha3.1 TaxID=1502746 RepID=UPI0008A78583|nr:tyrosine-type recombinase/integrase [Methylobacterium sp. 275MFSha3.1]SEH88703.1 Site-specific recombinase XerD [Methylobacterium sp. 275MFSha3.1]